MTFRRLATAALCLSSVALAQNNPPLKVTRSPQTGLVTFLSAADGQTIPPVSNVAAVDSVPAQFIRDYGRLFGVTDPVRQLAQEAPQADRLGHLHTTFRQEHQGVPVFGGILKVHQNAAGQVLAANGKFFPIPATLNPLATLTLDQAAAQANAGIKKGNPAVEQSKLVVVDPGWYGDPSIGAHLAYYLIMTDLLANVRQGLFVDAHTGDILDQWDLLHTALNRRIVNDETDTIVRTEGGPPTGDHDADAAYDYAGDVYHFLFNAFGRDSLNNAGLMMTANVHLQSTSCPNAFAGGSSTSFCTGTASDDVVAHEFGHILTGFTADLIYQNQPGQLNESFSDVWGEVVDLLNGDVAAPGAPGGTPWPPSLTGPGTDQPNDLRSICVTGAVMEITAPVSIAGEYAAQNASFGPQLTQTGVTGDIIVANPARACDVDLPFSNAGQFAGRIVLVDRGDCNFTEKVKNAQDFGAIAVIVANNVSVGLSPMGGSDPAVTIPSVGSSQADGALIKNAVTQGTVTGILRSNTGSSVRWLVGEDATAFGGAIRDMWQPSCAGDPDTANHPFQTCNISDGGGVHSGSGVPNHAFAMLTDGKTFNGQTVNGIGLFKAAAVWYRALTIYLTPTSNFQDAYVALNQAAADLVGTMVKDPRDGSNYAIFTSDDATEVDKALLATEMNTPGLCGDSLNVIESDPPTLCEGRVMVYSDSFESGVNGWTVSNSSPPTPYNWVQRGSLPFGRPGTAWFGEDRNVGNCGSQDESGLHSLFSPTIALPANLPSPTLAFTHYVETEPAYDGGNLKISVNGGAWAIVPKSAFTYNTYNEGFVPPPDNTNPIALEPAWSGISYDGGEWGTSVVDLTSFVTGGDSVRFRFDFGKDGCSGALGWFVDNFELFVCPSSAAPPPMAAEPGGFIKNRFISFLVPDESNGQNTAIRVELSSIHHPAGPANAPDLSAFEGELRFVNLIRDGEGNPVFDCVDSQSLPSSYKCATLGCEPEYRDWMADFGGAVLHVTGDAVAPSSEYTVAQLPATCSGNEAACPDASLDLTVATGRWGDVIPGTLNATDIAAVIDKVKDLPWVSIEPRFLLQPQTPDPRVFAVSALDIARSVDSVKGAPYPFTIANCP